jgi:hypothetical protein
VYALSVSEVVSAGAERIIVRAGAEARVSQARRLVGTTRRVLCRLVRSVLCLR